MRRLRKWRSRWFGSIWGCDVASHYWVESLGQALDDLGIRLTDEQVMGLAESCECIAEVRSQYTGSECIPNPLQTEIDRLKRAHADEMAMVKRRGERVELALIRRSGGDPELHYVHVDGSRVEVRR